MLGVKRVDHVSMAVWDLEKQVAFFENVFGWKVAGRFKNEREGYSGVVMDIGPGQPQWEILEPLGEHSFLRKFLRERGPGIHHVTMEVENADAAADHLRQCGIEPFGGPRVSWDWKEFFVHPRDTNGVLFQLYEHVPPPPGESHDHHEP